MSPRAWLWYWAVGWILGPILVVYGIIVGSWDMVFLGVAIAFTTVGLTAFWRQRLKDNRPSEPTSN
jgi:hypothetical protein